MKKFLTFGILIVVLAGILVPYVAFGQSTEADCRAAGGIWDIITVPPRCITNQNNPSVAGVAADAQLKKAGDFVFKALATGIAETLMKISSWTMGISGWLFDKVVEFSIVNMATNIGDPNGVGGAITKAWATLRDVANMCFIFVLLFAAFKAMFDTNFGNFGKTVKDIIIVALLINFSLFFSKVVIDASNIVAVGFYNSISSNTITRDGTQVKSISAGYENMLGVHTFYGTDVLGAGDLDAPGILVFGILSSVFMLITAVMLLMAGIMFLARFIILIFLMILSPLALIAFIIPGQKKHFEDWKDSLLAQSFFAPLYFALTWVVFKVGDSLLGALGKPAGATFSQITTNPKSAMALIVNFTLIVGLAIAAPILSKQMASKGATGGAFKAISGGIGGVAMGGTAWATRNTVGRVSGLVSEKKREEWSKSTLGRAGLWVADKGKKGSFDVRGVAGTGLGKAVGAEKVMGIAGKATGKGGFQKSVDEKAKAKAAYAKDVYGQTGAEKEEFENRKKREGVGIRADRAAKEANARAEAEKAEKERKKYMDEKLKPHAQRSSELNNEKRAKEEELRKAKEAGDKASVETIDKELEAITSKMANEREMRKEAEKEIEENDNAYKGLKDVADEKRGVATETKKKLNKKDIDDDEYSLETQAINKAGGDRQRAYAERLDKGLFGTRWLGPFQPKQGYKAAARGIREQAREKSKAEKIADLARESQKEIDEKEKTSETASAPSPTPSVQPAGGGTPPTNP
ncbi:MAG: hypothetical protein V1896_02960 [Candidatus Zambryskibacteria bacterium]